MTFFLSESIAYEGRTRHADDLATGLDIAPGSDRLRIMTDLTVRDDGTKDSNEAWVGDDGTRHGDGGARRAHRLGLLDSFEVLDLFDTQLIGLMRVV